MGTEQSKALDSSADCHQKSQVLHTEHMDNVTDLINRIICVDVTGVYHMCVYVVMISMDSVLVDKSLQ